jgi:hypothetical protein
VRASRCGDSAPEAEGISFRQGASTPLHLSRPELLKRLDGKQPAQTRHAEGQTCLLYLVTDQANTGWQFCFQREKLVTSNTVVNAPG